MSYQLGDSITLTFTAPADATVVLYLTAPDGTESTPTTSNVLTAWSATFTGNQLGKWLFAWRASGTGNNVDLGTLDVGEPWYSSLALLRSALNMASTDTTRDTLLTQALSGASRSVDKYCGRRFYLDAAATARVYTTAGRVMCRRWDERLTVDDIGDDADITVELGDGTTWTAVADYDLYPDNALATGRAITGFTLASGSWSAFRRARVAARWGWPRFPSEVEQATQLQSARLYRRKDSPEGVAGSPDWGLVRLPNLDPDVKALLAPFAPGFLVA